MAASSATTPPPYPSSANPICRAVAAGGSHRRNPLPEASDGDVDLSDLLLLLAASGGLPLISERGDHRTTFIGLGRQFLNCLNGPFERSPAPVPW